MDNYRILIVDDDQLILKALSNFLEKQDYRVTQADSGEKAVKMLKSNYFDLMICDIVMGKVDGLSVLKQAKKAAPLMAVIMLTGYGELASAIDALRLRADDYLLKPCEGEEIGFRVARCLEKIELDRKIKIYKSMLPICCVCKKIRDDQGQQHGTGKWLRLENYLKKKGVMLSHTYCPDCMAEAEKNIGISGCD